MAGKPRLPRFSPCSSWPAPLELRVGSLPISVFSPMENCPLSGILAVIPQQRLWWDVQEHFLSKVPELGHDLSVQNHNAIQGTFRFVA
jgi:hypothetical protein